MRHAVVDEERVVRLTVVAEALAVIAEDDDDRAIVDARRLELSDQATNLRVRKRNLTSIRAPFITREKWLGRIERRVGIVEVNPREEGLPRLLLDPRKRFVHHLIGRPLNARQRKAATLAHVEVVEERIEPLIDPPFRIEDIGRHERAGPVSAFFQTLGQRHLLRTEKEAAVVADAMLGWELPCEDRRVGGQRERSD